ncbi:outer dense fiber protein 3-like protein 2 [Anopheles bellator]|uniref:outer dense fiber protein 3-like protein 2 n=1 Tax=Anopheles bellator TaxID=139047 RepID=UPI00264A38BB|nr:outer dense fiber protein 3-like protein 2 [Anopheles bellator]
MNRFNGPAPNQYNLPPAFGFDNHDPRKERKPMYSMRARTNTTYKTPGPGPGAPYEVQKLTRFGRTQEVSYSMRLRLNPPKQDLVPGPDHYATHLVPAMNGKRAPHYSIRARLKDPNKDDFPAPNKYLGDFRVVRPTAPCYTIRARHKEASVLQSPGPDQYILPTCDVTHKRPPNYTIRARFPPIVDRNPYPGPASYGLMDQQVGESAPSYSFRVRYPHWTTPMIVPGDQC